MAVKRAREFARWRILTDRAVVSAGAGQVVQEDGEEVGREDKIDAGLHDYVGREGGAVGEERGDGVGIGTAAAVGGDVVFAHFVPQTLKMC